MYAAQYPRPWHSLSGATCPECPEPNDLAVLKNHLTQLLGVINANKELVLAVEMGTLGYWGENHYYDTTLNMNQIPRPYSWRDEVLSHQVATLDPDILVLARTPLLKANHTPTWAPLTASVALTEDRARVGHHNDCFMADESDMGTFGDDNTTYVEPHLPRYFVSAGCTGIYATQRFRSLGLQCDRDYWKNEAYYTLGNGETCYDGQPGRVTCEHYLGELHDYHFASLNMLFSQDVLALLNATCHDYARNYLGYRYELLSADVTVDTVGHYSLLIKNVGFSRPYQNIQMFLSIGGKNYSIPTTGSSDFRLLRSGLTFNFTGTFDPSSVPATATPVYLVLTDLSSSLQNNLNYTIRLGIAQSPIVFWSIQALIFLVCISFESSLRVG